MKAGLRSLLLFCLFGVLQPHTSRQLASNASFPALVGFGAANLLLPGLAVPCLCQGHCVRLRQPDAHGTAAAACV